HFSPFTFHFSRSAEDGFSSFSVCETKTSCLLSLELLELLELLATLPLMTQRPRHFASDNNAGISPEVLAALADANQGHVVGYGHDNYTERAQAAVSAIFERECAVFFVSNGTSANCLALSAFLQSYHAVLAHEHSHLETDECNALGHYVPGV